MVICGICQSAWGDSSTAPAGQGALFSEVVAAQLDWQPLNVVVADQQDRRCRQCAGKFIDPLAGQTPTEPRSADVEVSADTSSATEGNLVFTGDFCRMQPQPNASSNTGGDFR